MCKLEQPLQQKAKESTEAYGTEDTGVDKKRDQEAYASLHLRQDDHRLLKKSQEASKPLLVGGPGGLVKLVWVLHLCFSALPGTPNSPSSSKNRRSQISVQISHYEQLVCLQHHVIFLIHTAVCPRGALGPV